MEYEDPIGAYGPMRKLFVIEEVRFVRGGAIIPRFGHASFKRGLEREFTKFVNKLGCPVLLTVHGQGICEAAPMFVPLTDDVWVGADRQLRERDGGIGVRRVPFRPDRLRARVDRAQPRRAGARAGRGRRRSEEHTSAHKSL